ncbi:MULTISPECIES: transposase [Lachnospiraceae]|uniref:transposase n=1 Tax=Lachnospiraceae TaxID=186803 RepID=UPI00031C3DB6|nr:MULTISPECIES: transposase [Clostridia]MDU1140749.1 transposase [Enterocloster bolteae]
MEAYRQQQREFEACAKTYRAWRKEILNSFKYGLTNGKRKVLGWIAPYHKFLHNEHS